MGSIGRDGADFAFIYDIEFKGCPILKSRHQALELGVVKVGSPIINLFDGWPDFTRSWARTSYGYNAGLEALRWSLPLCLLLLRRFFRELLSWDSLSLQKLPLMIIAQEPPPGSWPD